MVAIKDIIKEIKNKQELSNLDDEFIKNKIEKELLNNKKAREVLTTDAPIEQIKKNKHFKELQKKIRSHLREIYGVFQIETQKEQFLEKINDTKKLLQLLQTHTSTKERLIHYSFIYKKLQEYIIPKTIIDIGCGINPLSYILLKEKPTHIFATDIAKKDMEFLQKALNKLEIKNTTQAMDLLQLNEEDIKKFTKNTTCDLCICLKLLDTLEATKKNSSRKILPIIPAKYFLISFAKFSLGGKKPIDKTKRNWFINMIKYLPFKEIISFECENELFYLLERTQ